MTSPLNPSLLSEAGLTAGSAAVAAELIIRKHLANDAKCYELGWTCIPLVVESYGAWGREAISRLASLLATRTNTPKSKVVSNFYGRLNLTFNNARSLLLKYISSRRVIHEPKLNFVVSVFYLFVYHNHISRIIKIVYIMSIC